MDNVCNDGILKYFFVNMYYINVNVLRYYILFCKFYNDVWFFIY